MKSKCFAAAFAMLATALGCDSDGTKAPDTTADSVADVADTAPDTNAPDTETAPDAPEETGPEETGPDAALPCGGPCGDHASCVDDVCTCDPGTLASGGACVLPAGIVAFRIEPGLVHAEQPIEARFEVSEAVACRLSSELFAAPIQVDAASLAAGRFALTLSAAQLEAVFADGRAHAKIGLVCDGAGAAGDNVATASVYVDLARGPAIEVSASATSVPTDGGLVDICWSSPEAVYCAVSGPIDAREDIGTAGCVEGLLVAPGQRNDFTVWCNDATENGASSTVTVVAGAGIQRFEVTPAFLGEGGMAHVEWAVVGVDDCALSQQDEVIATGASGELDLAVATQTVLTLTCTAGELVLSETRTISVGAAILSFSYDPRTPEQFSWSAVADTCTITIANETYSVVLDGLETGAKSSMLLPIPAATRDEGVAVTLRCERDGYTATRTVMLGGGPRITSVTFDPPSLPAAGALMGMCWSAERATACEIYLDGSGDAAGTFTADDCAALDVPPTGMYVRLECYGADAEATVWEAMVPSGPAASLAATPSVLAVAGTSTLTWSTNALEACALLKDGAFVAAVDAAGSRTVEVSDSSSFVLRCEHDGVVHDTAAQVSVGAGIVSFEVEPSLTGAGVAWETALVEACTLTIESGDDPLVDDTLVIVGLPDQQAAGPAGSGKLQKPPHNGPVTRGFAVPFDRAQPATLTFTCAGPHGTYERVVELAAMGPVEILTLTVTPERLPAEGSVVDVCVTSVDADRCSVVFYSLETGLGYLIGESTARPDYSRGNGCLSAAGVSMFFDESVEVVVTCQGLNSTAERRAIVSAGVAVASLVADPPWLPEAGTTLVSWSAVLAERCELRVDGALVASGTTGDAVPVALVETSRLVLGCTGADGETSERTLRVAIGTELSIDARPQGAYQLVVDIASIGYTSCVIEANNGDTFVGSGFNFEREEAPLEGSYSFDWQFENLGPADVTVTCTDAAGATAVRTMTVAPPPAPVITSFTAPAGFLAAGQGDVCFAASGADACDLYVEGFDHVSFPNAAGCWSDGGRGAIPFVATTNVTLICTSDLGVATSRSVVVPVGASVLGWTLDQSMVDAGDAVNVSWTTYGMTSCALSQNGEQAEDTLSGEVSFTLETNTHFVLSCVDASGKTYAHEADVLVGRQLARFGARAADSANLLVEWHALYADVCSVRMTTERGDERGEHPDLPTESGLVVPWDFATDGAAHVALRCISDGAEDLVATAIVVPPTTPAVSAFTASPSGLGAPGAVDICWATSGAIDVCFINVVPRDPAASPPVQFMGGGAGCASDATSLGAPLDLAHTADATLSCYGPLGEVMADLLIPVGPYVTMLRAEPSWFDAPGDTTVTWDTHAVTRCELHDEAGALVATGTSGAYEVSIAASTELTLTCASSAGEVTRRLGVGLGQGAFIEEAVALSADWMMIAWRAERSDFCTVTITGGAAVERYDLPPAGREFFYYPFAERGDAAIALACFGSESVTDSALVTSPTPRITTFDATPAAVASAGPAELCWSAVNADSCDLTFDGVVDTALAAVDCIEVDVVVAGAATLTCVGDFGETSATLPIALGPTILGFEAALVHLPEGGYFTTLTWQTVLTDDCTLSDGTGVVGAGTSGQARLFVATDTTFVLTCASGDETLTRSIDISTGPVITHLAGRANATGDGVVLDWKALYVSSCELALRDLDTGVVLNRARLSSTEVSGFELAFDFGMGHSAEATLSCSDDSGDAHDAVVIIAAP